MRNAALAVALTAMVVAREWERGTMEALMVTPVRIGELMVGKLAPYFILGMGGMLLSVAMALWLFDVPLRGSFWLLTAASALFMLVALGMGLLISVVARNQFVAGHISEKTDAEREDPGQVPNHFNGKYDGDHPPNWSHEMLDVFRTVIHDPNDVGHGHDHQGT